MNILTMYEEMRNKHGFSDGENVPIEAEVVRDLLVETINEVLGSESPVEAVAYDRGGLHNWCMIVYRRKDDRSIEESEPEIVREALEKLNDDGVLGSLYMVEITRSLRADAEIKEWVRKFRKSLETGQN